MITVRNQINYSKVNKFNLHPHFLNYFLFFLLGRFVLFYQSLYLFHYSVFSCFIPSVFACYSSLLTEHQSHLKLLIPDDFPGHHSGGDIAQAIFGGPWCLPPQSAQGSHLWLGSLEVQQPWYFSSCSLFDIALYVIDDISVFSASSFKTSHSPAFSFVT